MGEGLCMLIRFLAESFERHELRMFALELQSGPELIAELPGAVASPAMTASAFVATVVSRGLLDADFFATLLKHRALRSPEINAIRQRCLANVEQTGSVGPGVLLRGGRYRLEELLDHGGVGSIWLATDRTSGIHVAIKVLRRDMRDYKVRRWQFIKGASQMAAISNPRVAQVIEPHFTEMGHDFCVLQYVRGKSLADIVRDRRLTELQDIVKVILDVGAGLAALHPRIFHGDVSPKNIILGLDGHATLVDFDLAGETDDVPMTRATGNAGTDPFASPEWRARSDLIDARTDIFSLGMTLVYALYGHMLPSGLNDSRVGGPGPFIDKHLKCEPSIKTVLHRACAMELAERTPTIHEFCHTLQQAVRPEFRSEHVPLVSEAPSIAPPPEPPHTTTPPPPETLTAKHEPQAKHLVTEPPPKRVATNPPPEPPIEVAPERQVTEPPPVAPSTIQNISEATIDDAAAAPPLDPPDLSTMTEGRGRWMLPFILAVLILGASLFFRQLYLSALPMHSTDPSSTVTSADNREPAVASTPVTNLDSTTTGETTELPPSISTTHESSNASTAEIESPIELIGPAPPPPPPRKRPLKERRDIDDALAELEEMAIPRGQTCRERVFGPSEQPTPGEEDVVTLAIELSADGKVVDARPSGADVDIPLAKCLATALKKLKLSSFEGPALPFKHKFKF